MRRVLSSRPFLPPPVRKSTRPPPGHSLSIASYPPSLPYPRPSHITPRPSPESLPIPQEFLVTPSSLSSPRPRTPLPAPAPPPRTGVYILRLAVSAQCRLDCEGERWYAPCSWTIHQHFFFFISRRFTCFRVVRF